jgi:hypothetical protein
MANYAVVKDGVVVNIVVWNGESKWKAPDDSEAILISDGTYIDIGYLYFGSKFSVPSSDNVS